MHKFHRELVNTAHIELLPAHLLSARSNRDARALAGSDWVLRRKRDGRFLAVVRGRRVWPMVPALERETGLCDAMSALGLPPSRTVQRRCAVPADVMHLRALNIGADYSHSRHLPRIAEPARLCLAGFDRYERPLWLLAAAARAWQHMREAAKHEEIRLQAISGYRSIHYQHGIFDRKLARGLSIEAILSVNAAPGYSEHHSGCAIDIGSVGEPPAEASFEHTSAFAWLTAHAHRFGFVMSYPRHNRHGVMFEPWHWCWHPPAL